MKFYLRLIGTNHSDYSQIDNVVHQLETGSKNSSGRGWEKKGFVLFSVFCFVREVSSPENLIKLI